MNLKLLVDDVQESRARTAGVFPLPDAVDCIDYAITEAAEYLDAMLRQRRAGDKRNNDKAHDARKELGQCGYMICSAVMQINTSHLDALDWQASQVYMASSIYSVLGILCEVQSPPSDYQEVDALDAWHAFALHCGWNPAELIRETCADFERKHLGVAA